MVSCANTKIGSKLFQKCLIDRNFESTIYFNLHFTVANKEKKYRFRQFLTTLNRDIHLIFKSKLD